MAANRTISIRLTVAEADQFKQAFQQAGAAGQAAMNTLTQSVTASSGALHAHTQAAGLANYQIVELTESAHKFADIILSGGSAIRGLEFELPKFIGIAGGVTQALGAVGKALPLLGIAAAAVGIYELGKAANDQQSRMALLGQQVRATRDDYTAYAKTLDDTARKLALTTPISLKDARETVNTIGTNPNFSGNSTDITRLSKDAEDLSVIFKTDLAGGTKIVTDGLNDAAKAAKNLEEKGIAGFTPGLVRSIQLLQDAGKYSDAFSLYLKTLEGRSSGAADAGLTPLQSALKRLDESFNGSREGARTWSEAVGAFIDKVATDGVNALTHLIEKMEEGHRIAAAAVAVNPDTQAAATPDATGQQVLLGPTIPGRSERAHGIMQVLPSTAAGFHLNPDIQDQNILAGLEDLQQKVGRTGSVDAGLAAYGGATSPDKAAAYVAGVRGQNVAKLPADVASQIDYWGQIIGLPPDLIDIGKRIALQESGGHQYGSGGSTSLPVGAGKPITYRRSDFDPSDTLPPSTNMINSDRKSAEDIAREIEGTRAATQQSLTAELAKIEAQLQQLRTSGRTGSTDYMGLEQREQQTQAALYNNVGPQQEAVRQGENQLNTGRLARRYGFTPADQQLAAGVAAGQERARVTGDPFTSGDQSALESQAYQKADEELSRLEATQTRAVLANENLAKAYAKGSAAVADYTAMNQAMEQANATLPTTIENRQQKLDALAASYRRVAQSAEDMRAAEQSANDNKSAAASNEQIRLLNSGESTNQQAQDYAAFQARQTNQTASPSTQDAVAGAAQQRVSAEQALASTRANYNELQSFGSNTFDRIGSSMTSAFTSGANAAKSFSSIAKSAFTDIAQEFEKLAVLNPIKNAIFGGNSPTLSSAGGLLGSLLGSVGGSVAASSASAITSQAGTTGVGILAGLGGLYHSGGIVGYEPTSMRMVDPSVFYGAPRMHTGGIAGGEVPAVLQAGEGVFTPGQMAALGAGMGGSQQGGDTHFHFNVNAQGAGPREIDQLKTQIPLMSLQAVQSAMQRGGQFAKTVRGS